MEFEEFSKGAVKKIDKQLSHLLKEWRGEVGKIDNKLLPLVDKFIASCDGGKKLRGVLVVLGYEIAAGVDHLGGVMASQAQPATIRGDISGEIYKIAAAYEILHSAILAHDDIIDQSPKRRGQASLYKAIGQGHYGVSQAISLGDAGFFLAARIVAESSFSEREKNQALSWLAGIMLETAAGEILDVDKGDVLAIMKLKTARYSVAGPLQLGAILVNADQKLVRELGEFGENLGLAFQIQDDILGVFGSAKQTGKSVTADIADGKNTLLYNYALAKGNSAQRQILANCYGRGIQVVQGYQSVRQIFQDTGALDYARKEADRNKIKAMKVLPSITRDLRMSKILEQMTEYMVERSK